MTDIKLFHPKHTSSVVSLPKGTDITKWTELGFQEYHENNKDFLFVDYTPLFDWIKETLELPKDTVISMDFSGTRLQFNDVKIPVLGAFAAAIKECTFGMFSFTKSDSGFWATLNLNYIAHTRGYNGIQFAEIEWNNVAGWKVCETQIGRWHCL